MKIQQREKTYLFLFFHFRSTVQTSRNWYSSWQESNVFLDGYEAQQCIHNALQTLLENQASDVCLVKQPKDGLRKCINKWKMFIPVEFSNSEIDMA